MNLDNRIDTSRYGLAVPLWLLVALNTESDVAQFVASVAAIVCSIADFAPVAVSAYRNRKLRQGGL